MALVPLPRPSWRIRAYLAIRGFLYLWFALTYTASQDRLSANPTFDVVETLMPIEWFAGVFVAVGIACLGGVAFPAESPTRVLLGISAVVSVLFGFGLMFAGTLSPASGAFISAGLIDLLLTGTDYRPRR